MSTVLYIQASPRTGDPGRSHSDAAARAFLDAYLNARPEASVDTVNLFDTTLPEFNGPLINIRYNMMHGLELSAEDEKEWGEVETLIEQFMSADIHVLAVPMWNFSIPYRLKHYIDLICQPGHTFSSGPEGYAGLTRSKGFIAYARGGEYPVDTPMAAYNFQSPYLEHILGFMGVAPIRSVAVEPLLQDPEIRDRVKAAAAARAAEVAEEFLGRGPVHT